MLVERDGKLDEVAGSDFISSMPITELIKKLDPAPPAPLLDAASRLRYRDFLTVCLIVNQARVFDDNWIYVHDPGVDCCADSKLQELEPLHGARFQSHVPRF